MQHKERKKAKKKKKGYMDVLRWKKYTKITIGTVNKIEVAAAMDFECHCCQIEFVIGIVSPLTSKRSRSVLLINWKLGWITNSSI